MQEKIHTKQDLIADLRALGIRPDDTVMVHTALRSVGRLETGEKTSAEILIEALRDCLSEGLLLIPTHTWGSMKESGALFDVLHSPPCIGALPSEAVRMARAAWEGGTPDILRSHHPTHSVVAIGVGARAYIQEDTEASTPTPWNASFGKLYACHGKVLLIGVGQERNTYLHAVEEWLELPHRLSEEDTVRVTAPDGKTEERKIRRHLPREREYFPDYEPYLEAGGALFRGRLGDAACCVCDARAAAEIVKRITAETPDKFYKIR